MTFIDSHCHLNYPDFKDDRNEIIARAKEASVSHMLTICTRMSEAKEIYSIAENNNNIFASIGVHPHDAEKHNLETLKDLIEPFLTKSKTVAIGETGLDYYYENSPRAEQIKSFELHMELAEKYDLPVIIHTRNADEDTISMLGKFPKVRGVIHCFSGNQKLADACLDMGYYISLSGIITFKKAEELREVAKSTSLNKLLIETDAPFLAPIPFRGRRNEPSYVVEVAKKLAYIKQVQVEEIAKITSQNFFDLFTRAVNN